MNPEFLWKWLRASKSGDEDAFRNLVEATRDTLFWTARRMVGRDALAEEILQDAYLALWGLPSSKLPQNPEAWLRRTIANRCIDHLRLEEVKKPHLGLDDVELHSDGRENPLERLGSLEAEERLEQALASLPSKMRAAIVLKMEGYGYDEISTFLSVTESTVRNHVLQARNRLAPWFRDGRA